MRRRLGARRDVAGSVAAQKSVKKQDEHTPHPGPAWDPRTLSPRSLSKLVHQLLRRVGWGTQISATPSRARRRMRSYPRSRAKVPFVEFPRRPACHLRLPPPRAPLEGVRTKYMSPRYAVAAPGNIERTSLFVYICGIANGRRVRGHPQPIETVSMSVIAPFR